MSKLTVIMPTRDRPHHVGAQLRFLRRCGLQHRVIVADESKPEEAAQVLRACEGIAEHRHFRPAAQPTSWLRFADKTLQVLQLVDTPYVLLTPDDDITLPHAIDAAVAHLDAHHDVIAAHGYWMRFVVHGDNFDIDRVAAFTPSIADATPLARVYHLMRRYQQFLWSVFRVGELAAALTASMQAEGVLFQELMFMNAAIARGKVARLQLVFGLRGVEESLTSLTQSHPFFWFLHDREDFFRAYRQYRLTLARHLRGLGIEAPRQASLDHLLDIVHAIWATPSFELGTLDRVAQAILAGGNPAVAPAVGKPEWREPAGGDFVHSSGVRRYIWRDDLIRPDLRHEIVITADEMARVERQLDHYVI